MNPCECFFNHEMAMRRLLSFLRQSQTECNDNECFDLTNLRMGEGGNMADNSLIMYSMLWIVIGFLLFFFRPQSLRNSKNFPGRSSDDSDDHSGSSPMAPQAH